VLHACISIKLLHMFSSWELGSNRSEEDVYFLLHKMYPLYHLKLVFTKLLSYKCGVGCWCVHMWKMTMFIFIKSKNIEKYLIVYCIFCHHVNFSSEKILVFAFESHLLKSKVDHLVHPLTWSHSKSLHIVMEFMNSSL
jgi:hypothetical protein